MYTKRLKWGKVYNEELYSESSQYIFDVIKIVIHDQMGFLGALVQKRIGRDVVKRAAEER